MLSLHASDKIRMLRFPESEVRLVRSTITRTWPRGLDVQRPYSGSEEFKLRGYPWQGTGDDAVHSRRMLAGVLSGLYAAGWLLYISTDVSKRVLDKDSLLFRHCGPDHALPQSEWFAMSFSRSDRIRLIDAPKDVVGEVVACCKKMTQSHGPYSMPNVYELRFKDGRGVRPGRTPWSRGLWCWI
jgi:hypothetical protein